jgi:hypothetical protein
MNLFRSEAHIVRWLGPGAPGRTIPVRKLSELAHRWWGDRLSPTWVPRTRDENQSILHDVGLTGAFWRLG